MVVSWFAVFHCAAFTRTILLHFYDVVWQTVGIILMSALKSSLHFADNGNEKCTCKEMAFEVLVAAFSPFMHCPTWFRRFYFSHLHKHREPVYSSVLVEICSFDVAFYTSSVSLQMTPT